MKRILRGLAAGLALLFALQAPLEVRQSAAPLAARLAGQLGPAPAGAQTFGGQSVVVVLGQGTWSPSRLFSAGQAGAWFDVSDLSSLAQDSAGTTPAAVNSPIGKIVDKSGSGCDLTQSVSSKRPTLRASGALFYAEFDGVDDELDVPTPCLDLFKNVSTGSLFATLAVSNTTQAQPLMFGWSIGVSASTRMGFLPNSTDLQAGGRRLDADAFAAATAAAVLSANTPFVASGLFDFANTKVTLRKDRAQVAQNTSFQTAGSTSNVSSNKAGINIASPAFAGRFYAGLALRGLPDNTTVTRLENYLAAKGGL